MPLPELVDQMRLGLQQVNQNARAWQDRYVSPETGEFIVRRIHHITGISLTNGSVAFPFQTLAHTWPAPRAQASEIHEVWVGRAGGEEA